MQEECYLIPGANVRLHGSDDRFWIEEYIQKILMIHFVGQVENGHFQEITLQIEANAKTGDTRFNIFHRPIIQLEYLLTGK